MARRAYAEQLNPYSIVEGLGEVNPYKVRQLLQAAETAHKLRKFHELGVYLRAADFALHKWLTVEIARATDKGAELKRWALPVDAMAINPSSATRSRACGYSHTAGNQVALKPASYGNTEDSAEGRRARRYQLCRCGHNHLAHNFELGTCEALDHGRDGCDCDGFELASC